MITVFLSKKRTRSAIIRSLSEGTLSVQNICAVTTVGLLVAGIDSISYVWFGFSCCTLSRILLCMAVVYCWPFAWFIALGPVVLATISHQAGGQELMICALVMSLLRYASLRMVNTDFSHRVLIAMGYSFMEMMSYLIIVSVPARELGSHLLVAIVLFLMYTLFRGSYYA